MSASSESAPIPVAPKPISHTPRDNMADVLSPPPPSASTTAALDTARRTTTSPPIDPSKLNNQPAPLPIPTAEHPHIADPLSPPLRSPPSAEHSSGGGSSAPLDSAYLDSGAPVEPASHPTIAETGVLATSPDGNPGPRQGQLKRVEKKDGEIIKLGSLGGEGLAIKPPVPLEGER